MSDVDLKDKQLGCELAREACQGAMQVLGGILKRANSGSMQAFVATEMAAVVIGAAAIVRGRGIATAQDIRMFGLLAIYSMLADTEGTEIEKSRIVALAVRDFKRTTGDDYDWPDMGRPQ